MEEHELSPEGTKRAGRKSLRPARIRRDYLIGWSPAGAASACAPAVGRPRISSINDADLVSAVAELTNKDCSERQALIFLANYAVVDRKATEIESLSPWPKPSEAWDLAGIELEKDKVEAARLVWAEFERLRKRLPEARNRFSP